MGVGLTRKAVWISCAIVFATVCLGAGAAFLRLRALTPQNVILITVDTLRADRLSSYGYEASPTPAIDRLAREGARFATAYCDVPWTTASLASVMTGTFGPKHGFQHFWNRLADDRLTLAELLQADRFTTGAVVGSYAVDSAFGLDQGFDSYDDTLDTPQFLVPGAKIEDVPIVMGDDREAHAASITKKMFNNAYRVDKEVTAAATDWLRSHREPRFFLWVHYFGPHERIVVEPGTMQGERIIADYDEDLRETDDAIAALLAEIDSLGLTDRTLVVLHSDHGQALGEHENIGHGRNLYEEAVRIPLLVRFPPAVTAGTVVDAVGRNVDIFPTIADFLRAPIPDGLDGRSLVAALDGKRLEDVPAYMELIGSPPVVMEIPDVGECSGPSNWLGVRFGSWKYLSASLDAPCVTGALRYNLDMLGINPTMPVRATPLPDERCTELGRRELYEIAGAEYGIEQDERNLFSSRAQTASGLEALVQSIVTHREDSTALELNEVQRSKLRSLGYLQ